MAKTANDNIEITKKMLRRFLFSLVNIASHEWPRVSYCFSLKFLIDMGKVIGHTILLSMVTSRLGIEALPIIMVISGFLIMVSTTIFSRLLHKVGKSRLLIFMSLGAAVILTSARVFIDYIHLFSGDLGTYLFFSLYLIAEAMLFIQIEIILALYIEDHFTPLESQRAFPVVESGQIIAGIVGGSLIAFSHFKTPDLIYIWIACLILGAILIILNGFLLKKYGRKVNEEEKIVIHKDGFFKETLDNVKTLRMYPFLKMMSIVVFLYYVISKIIEFQYTKAVAVLSGGEESLTHGLGYYIIGYSLLAIIIELLLSSRVLSKWGIVNGMIINPLVSLLGFFLMLFFGNPMYAIAGKLSFDSSGVIYKNAYLSSFYAVGKNIRETMKGLIEGWVMPLGMIIGTLFVVLIQYFDFVLLDLIIRIFLIICATIMIVVLFKLRRYYTKTAVGGLSAPNIHERYNSIEILGQRGHIDNSLILTSKLSNWINKPAYEREKHKILDTLGNLKDELSISTILDCFEDSSQSVRHGAVKALSNFENMGKKFYGQTFARFRIFNTLKDLFEKENSKKMRSLIISVFANLDQLEVVPFLLKTLNESSDDIKSDCISVIGKFNDPNIYYYLKQYLDSDNPHIKANTIIALWQFKELRLLLLNNLTGMLYQATLNKEVLISGIYAVGELKAKQEEKKIEELAESDDIDIKVNAVIALLKIDGAKATSKLVDLFFKVGYEMKEKIKVMLENIEEDLKEKSLKLIEQGLSLKIYAILSRYNYDFKKIKEVHLEELQSYYSLMDEEEEVIKIEEEKVRRLTA